MIDSERDTNDRLHGLNGGSIGRDHNSSLSPSALKAEFEEIKRSAAANGAGDGEKSHLYETGDQSEALKSISKSYEA